MTTRLAPQERTFIPVSRGRAFAPARTRSKRADSRATTTPHRVGRRRASRGPALLPLDTLLVPKEPARWTIVGEKREPYRRLRSLLRRSWRALASHRGSYPSRTRRIDQNAAGVRLQLPREDPRIGVHRDLRHAIRVRGPALRLMRSLGDRIDETIDERAESFAIEGAVHDLAP